MKHNPFTRAVHQIFFPTCFFFFTAASLIAADLSSGLSIHWSFNDTLGRGIFDSSGKSNHSRIFGEPTREDGRVGRAARFGAGRYTSIPFSEPVIKPGSEDGAFSIVAWVKADGDQGSREHLILGKPGFHAGLMAHSERGENSFGFTMWNKSSKSFSVNSPPIADFNAWHHLVLVYEARKMILYLDGKPVRTTVFEGEIRDYPNQIFAGGLSRGNFDFKGLLDEVRVYSRALSEEDAKSLYALTEVVTTGVVPGEEPVPVVRLEKNRPELSKPLFTGKPVIAHYMTQMNTFGHDKNYFMNPAYGLPDGPASNIGGAYHYNSLFAHALAGKPAEEVIEMEIRAAKKLGIDGFHFYYQSPEPGPEPGAGNNLIIRQFFKVLENKKIDFKLTLCLSHPNQPVETAEKIRAASQAIKSLLAEFKDSPYWLRAPDGRIVFFTWSSEGFADGVRNHNDLFRKPDIENHVKALAEGYESLHQLLGVPAAFVFHAWDVDTMYLAIRDLTQLDLTKHYEAYIDAVLGYFPAVTGFADYPVNETTTKEWAKWGEGAAKRGRAYGQAVMTDYVKTYKKNGKLPGAPDFPALKIGETKSLYLALAGGAPFRGMWQRAVDYDAAFVSFVTWNDYPEGHHLAPEINHNYAFAVLNLYYEKIWRKEKPALTNDTAMVFFHKYPVEAKPLIFPMKSEVVPWHVGREPVDLKTLDVIDVSVLLKAPGEVWVNGKKHLSAKIGLSSFQIPLAVGPVQLEIRRGGTVVKTLRPPEWITDKPYRTDRLIYAYSTECENLQKEIFGNAVLPKADEYAQDAAGIPNWKKRYRIPEMSVAIDVKKIIPLQSVAPSRFPENLPLVLNIESKSNIQELPIGNPKEPWSGVEDLSGKLFLANDATSLFVRISARDDKHVDPPTDPSQMWRTDSLQLGVATSEGKQNLECGLALRGEETLFTVWKTPVKDADKRIERSIQREGTVIFYNLRIPLDLFGLKPGDLIGVSALINDTDVKERKAFMEFGTGIGFSKEPDAYNQYQLSK